MVANSDHPKILFLIEADRNFVHRFPLITKYMFIIKSNTPKGT